jgi:hypothetical protein
MSSILSNTLALLPDSCSQYFDPASYTNNTLSALSRFDNNLGFAALVGGDTCQQQLTTTVTIAYHAINLYAEIDPTVYSRLGVSQHDLDLLYLNWLIYSDGRMLTTFWSWPAADVPSGESIGLCLGQTTVDPLSYLSCWSLMKQADGTYEKNKSYLVNP